jgi:hypothetical protein
LLKSPKTANDTPTQKAISAADDATHTTTRSQPAEKKI